MRQKILAPYQDLDLCPPKHPVSGTVSSCREAHRGQNQLRLMWHMNKLRGSAIPRAFMVNKERCKIFHLISSSYSMLSSFLMHAGHVSHNNLVRPQADHPLLVGAVVDWNLSDNLLLFIEEIHKNNTVAIIFPKCRI